MTLAWAVTSRHSWGLGNTAAWLAPVSAAGLVLQTLHMGIRAWCSSRVYGWRFAAAAPVRVVAANWINFFATYRAIRTYAIAKWHGRPLRWVKTDHAYPNRAALITGRRKLGDILVGHCISAHQLQMALDTQPPDCRLGVHLISLGLITEEDLYAALAQQNQLPTGKPEPSAVSVPVTRALPLAVARKWRVLPFRIAAGELYLAGAEIPGEAMNSEIRQFSSMDIRFQLVTPTEYLELAAQYLD